MKAEKTDHTFLISSFLCIVRQEVHRKAGSVIFPLSGFSACGISDILRSFKALYLLFASSFDYRIANSPRKLGPSAWQWKGSALEYQPGLGRGPALWELGKWNGMFPLRLDLGVIPFKRTAVLYYSLSGHHVSRATWSIYVTWHLKKKRLILIGTSYCWYLTWWLYREG